MPEHSGFSIEPVQTAFGANPHRPAFTDVDSIDMIVADSALLIGFEPISFTFLSPYPKDSIPVSASCPQQMSKPVHTAAKCAYPNMPVGIFGQYLGGIKIAQGVAGDTPGIIRVVQIGFKCVGLFVIPVQPCVRGGDPDPAPIILQKPGNTLAGKAAIAGSEHLGSFAIPFDQPLLGADPEKTVPIL